MTAQDQPSTENLTAAESADESLTPIEENRGRRPSLFATTALVLVVIALCTLAWQWFNTRQRFTQLEQTLTQRLEQFGANNQQSLALAKSADERSTEAAAHATLLEQKLAESQDQQEALQTLYLELAN